MCHWKIDFELNNIIVILNVLNNFKFECTCYVELVILRTHSTIIEHNFLQYAWNRSTYMCQKDAIIEKFSFLICL